MLKWLARRVLAKELETATADADHWYGNWEVATNQRDAALDESNSLRIRLEAAAAEATRAWKEFQAEVARCEWQAEQHAFHAMSRDAYRQVGQELKEHLAIQESLTKGVLEDRDWWRDWMYKFRKWGESEERSRHGWKWLYEQKCEQWVEMTERWRIAQANRAIEETYTNFYMKQLHDKDVTIERLEAQVKRLGRNDRRDSRGRFAKSG